MNEALVRQYWERNAPVWTLLSRAGYDVCRDYQTAPAFFQMLPDVTGLTGLDIGCGEGHNTRQLEKRGARVVALDIAPSFLRAAREHESPGRIHYLLASALEMPFRAWTFDFATAFMSLMDVAGPENVLPEVARVLKPGGFLQFSILHPCFSPMHRRIVRNEAGVPIAIEVARYFDRVDGEIERWIFNAAPPEARAGLDSFEIPRFHRTLAGWLNTLVAAGLAVEQCVEPGWDENAAPHPGLADTRIAPNFLLLRCRLSSTDRLRPL
ncbi:MAG: methyltransferase domain-containing protein [Acidobacteriia bacterium]|nr:methyltransferase domain-containing protein [Terriglobia bacterium]